MRTNWCALNYYIIHWIFKMIMRYFKVIVKHCEIVVYWIFSNHWVFEGQSKASALFLYDDGGSFLSSNHNLRDGAAIEIALCLEMWKQSWNGRRRQQRNAFDIISKPSDALRTLCKVYVLCTKIQFQVLNFGAKNALVKCPFYSYSSNTNSRLMRIFSARNCAH